MPRLTWLWSAPLFVVGGLAQLAVASCSSLGPAPPPSPYADPYGWDDATTTSSGAFTGASSGAPPSSGSSGSGGGGGTTSSGSSGMGATSGGSGSGESSGGSSGSPSGDPSDGGAQDGYMVRNCGDTPCDLHFKTCCLPGDAGALDAAYCVGGTQTACGANIVTYHCLGAADCPISGNVCCGVYDLNAQTAGTQCQTGPCQIAQFCMGDPECSGVKCTAQSCQGISPLYMCGLQSAAPYNCTAVVDP